MSTVTRGIVKTGLKTLGILVNGIVNAQGESGPRVRIQRNNDPGFCEYEPPNSYFCATSETYTAVASGFSGSPLSYSWSVSGGTAIITGSNQAQTCTVETQNSGSNQTFQLACIVSNADPESVEKIVFFTQNHTDINETPVFVGPDINNATFPANADIGEFDFSVLFTGTNLEYSIVGTLPDGLSFASDTGILTGTPTLLQTEPLTVSVTNSKGTAQSNQFSLEIINISETVTISGDRPLSCTWGNVGDGCTVSADYLATPAGFINPVDLWVWSISSGTGTIVAGQGTDTVTVEQGGSADSFFTVKVVASNGFGESAENLYQVTTVHEEFTGPVFHAATFDPDTYECLLQRTGVGVPESIHTSDLYAPDFEGTQRVFGEDEPVWSGGRVVNIALTNSNNFDNPSYWNAPSNGGILTTGVVDPKGGNEAFRLTTTVGTSALSAMTANRPNGEGYRYISLWMRSDDALTNCRVYRCVGSQTEIVTDRINTEWQRVYVSNAYGIGTNDATGILLYDVGASVEFCWFQVETRTESDAIPSEYIPTTTAPVTKVFANYNGNTVTDNVVTEVAGAPLPEQPWLQYYPTATNSQVYSRDLTNAAWTKSGLTATYDKVGLTGEPNTASELPDIGAVLGFVRSGLVPDATTNVSTYKIWLDKQSIGSDGISRIRITNGGNGNGSCLDVNKDTGAAGYSNNDTQTANYEVISDGGRWCINLEYTGDTTPHRISIYPAATATIGGADATAAVGSIIVGNVELHLNKTIAQVRGLGPIFTEGTAVSTDAVGYTFDDGNHNDTGAYYLDLFNEGINDTNFSGILGLGANGRLIYSVGDISWRSYDGSTLYNGPSTGIVPDTQYNLGIAYGDGSRSINSNSVWGADGVYDGIFNNTLNRLAIAYDENFVAGNLSAACKIRNIQRIDITSYDEGKAWVDEQMAAARTVTHNGETVVHNGETVII